MIIKEDNKPAFVHRRAVEDPDLSLKAIGLLAILETFPGSITTGEIRNRRKIGKKALRSALRELQAGGYIGVEPEGRK